MKRAEVSVSIEEIIQVAQGDRAPDLVLKQPQIVNVFTGEVYPADVVIYDGKIASLRRIKDDVREVQAGFECGIHIADYNDVKEGDVIEAYEIVEIKRHLE